MSCNGPVNHEVCQDAPGNWIPTTDNTQRLGSSALRWRSLNLGTGGLIFPDFSVQTTAAGSGVWGVNGPSIFYTGGNVGIGTSVPMSLLDVTGSVLFRSTLSVTGVDPFGYSLALSSSVRLSCVKYGDGTVQCSAASGSSNQTTFTSTITVIAQDASGFSLKLSSGINAINGCILLQGGLVCGPTSGAASAGGWVTDNFIPDGVKTQFILSGIPSNPNAIFVELDGLTQSATTDYLFIAPSTITFRVAPAANSAAFFISYATGTIPVGSGNPYLALNQTWTGVNIFNNANNSFTGDGSGLTNVSQAQFIAVGASTASLEAQISAQLAAVTASTNSLQSQITALDVSTAALQTQVYAVGQSTNAFVKKAGDTMTGQLTISGATETITGQDANGYSLKVSSSIQAQCINLSGGQVCGPSTATAGVAGSGTTGKLAKWTGVTSLGDSIVSESGSVLTVAGSVTATSFSGDGSNLTGIQHDPQLFGINVKQGSATAGYEFFGSVGTAYYYIGSPPPNILGKATDVFLTYSATEKDTNVVAFVAGTMKNLACVWDTDLFNGNNGLSVTFTVRKNETDTSLTCTKSANAGGPTNQFNCNDASNTVSFSAGDRISLKLVTTGTITTKKNGACYFQYAF